MELTDKEKELVLKYENELDELFNLTEIEYEKGYLTEQREKRYIELVEILQSNNVPIEFGIEL